MNTLEIISQALSQQKKDVTRVETKLKNTQTELIKQLNYVSQEVLTKAGGGITLDMTQLAGSTQMVTGTNGNITITEQTLKNALPSDMSLSDFISSLQNNEKSIRIIGTTQTDTNPITWNAYATVIRQMVGSIDTFLITCGGPHHHSGRDGDLEETSLQIVLMINNSSFYNGFILYNYLFEYDIDNAAVYRTIEENELATASAITDLDKRLTNVEKNGVGGGSATVETGTTSIYGVVKISNGDVNTVAHSEGLVAGMDHSHSNYLTTANAKTLYGMPVNKFNSASVTLKPNQYHQMTGSTSRSSFTISFSAVTDSSICNEYFVEFPCYYNNMTLTVPSGVKWANGTAPTMNSGSTYQISFINNLAVYTEFR